MEHKQIVKNLSRVECRGYTH